MYTEAVEDGIDNLQELNLIEERVAAHHICVALIELAVAPFLWTVGTPYGLQLVALEGHLQFVAMLYDVACERHGEVVAQAFLAELCSEVASTSLTEVGRADTAHEVTGVENLEEEFIAFFAILTHEGGEVLHGRGFYLAVSVEGIDLAYGIEDIVALCHLNGGEVARSFGDGGFWHVMEELKN